MFLSWKLFTIYIYIYIYSWGASCRTTWAVYVIACGNCGSQYTGCTNSIRKRMNNHKSDLEAVRTGDESDRGDCRLLYTHLITCGSTIFFQIVQTFDESALRTESLRRGISDLWVILREAEREWMYRLDSLTPNGLNVDDGTYSQNRKTRQPRH